ncbi:MAG: pyridoxal phosphate-dependent aminotransferase family protein [Planctomycetota bacterium]
MGLSTHPDVLEAYRVGLSRFGASASASPITSGRTEAHESLEESLADYLGQESALVLPTGELANLALLDSRRDEIDAALIDADSHPSLVHAARLAGLAPLDYGRGDRTRLLALCDRFRDDRIWVLTDGVFPAQGRLAPVPDLLRDLPAGGWLLLDDSHGFGVLGEAGRGTLQAFGTPGERVVQSFSLAKALGVAGGALVGPANCIEAVARRSEVYQGSTALAPAAAMAARAALDVLEADRERRHRLARNTNRLQRLRAGLGVAPAEQALPVWSWWIPEEAQAQAVYADLLRAGLYVPLTRYGGSQAGLALRISVSSEHSLEDLDRLAQALAPHFPR